MPWKKNGLQRKSWKKRGAASSGSQSLLKKVLKKRALQSKKQMMLERCLFVEGQHINKLLLSMGSMLKATRDLIQNNEVIPIESIRALEEQNEIINKQIKVIKTYILFGKSDDEIKIN